MHELSPSRSWESAAICSSSRSRQPSRQPRPVRGVGGRPGGRVASAARISGSDSPTFRAARMNAEPAQHAARVAPRAARRPRRRDQPLLLVVAQRRAAPSPARADTSPIASSSTADPLTSSDLKSDGNPMTPAPHSSPAPPAASAAPSPPPSPTAAGGSSSTAATPTGSPPRRRPRPARPVTAVPATSPTPATAPRWPPPWAPRLDLLVNNASDLGPSPLPRLPTSTADALRRTSGRQRRRPARAVPGRPARARPPAGPCSTSAPTPRSRPTRVGRLRRERRPRSTS